MGVFDLLSLYINPVALRKAKIAYNFGLSGCSRVNTGSSPSRIISDLCHSAVRCSFPFLTNKSRSCKKDLHFIGDLGYSLPKQSQI